MFRCQVQCFVGSVGKGNHQNLGCTQCGIILLGYLVAFCKVDTYQIFMGFDTTVGSTNESKGGDNVRLT